MSADQTYFQSPEAPLLAFVSSSCGSDGAKGEPKIACSHFFSPVSAYKASCTPPCPPLVCLTFRQRVGRESPPPVPVAKTNTEGLHGGREVVRLSSSAKVPSPPPFVEKISPIGTLWCEHLYCRPMHKGNIIFVSRNKLIGMLARSLHHPKRLSSWVSLHQSQKSPQISYADNAPN